MVYKWKILESVNPFQRKFFYYFRNTLFIMVMDCVQWIYTITQRVGWVWIMFNRLTLKIDNGHKV